KKIIVTNSEWKVYPDLSWSDKSPLISRFQPWVNDRVDLRLKTEGWNNVAFDDREWDYATVLKRDVGWPSFQKNANPGALIPPWTALVPRDIPYLNETDVRAETIIEASETDYNPVVKDGPEVPYKLSMISDKSLQSAIRDYSVNNKPLIIPPAAENKSWFILFDLGEAFSALPGLKIKGREGTLVEVLYAPYMLNDEFNHKIIDSEFRDRIILSGSVDTWEGLYFKPTRYMAIIVEGNKDNVELYYAGVKSLAYPFEDKGSLKAPENEWVASYWKASKKTINICTTDGYTDNYRERRQYAQTGYYAALGNYWTFGDHALQRRYLVQVALEQKANGIMPAYAPSFTEDYMVIFDSNCLWIRSLYNYLLYSGDYLTVKELLPAARKLMKLFHQYTNEKGLIYDPPYAYWIDHSNLDRRGASFALNGHYLGALEDFAKILEWMDEEDPGIYYDRAKKLRSSLRKYFWNDDEQMFADAFIDGEMSDMFSEHSAALALSLNIADKEQGQLVSERILKPEEHNYISRESGLTMVTPAMSYFLHKGLSEYGYIEESFNLFRERFDHMLIPGSNYTLWEEWWYDGTGRTGRLQNKTRSDAQTESAFPPALFVEFIFGVRPVAPGLKEIEIVNYNSGVNNIEGRFPTPEGILEVIWSENRKGQREVELHIPGEMKVKLDSEKFEPVSNKHKTGMRNYDKTFTAEGDILLTNGNYKLKVL
ncbi:MAG: hypothetical protein KAS71_13365, partial [Bacteroidales bacterium]|nr:hypothetical protein [Bacteroidales bacterium]